MRQFFRKQNHLYGQLFLLLALNLLSGFILYGKPFADDMLYGDVLYLYSLFRDNLNSLNYFGEIAWWNPSGNFGFPLYYLSILGHTLYNPFFVALAAACWLLGLMNIHITSFVTLYSIYVIFFIPLLFSFSCLLFARQVFRNNLIITLILLMTSFSPGIIMNHSHDGLLLTALSFFFAAALLSFLAEPAPSRFWALCVSILLNALSFNHVALYWNVLFIPLFFGVCILIPGTPLRLLRDRIAFAISKWHWAAAFVACGVCLLPTLITFADGTDLVRTTTGTQWYFLELLQPGNPLEALTVSTPAIGFFWSKIEALWRPYSFFQAEQDLNRSHLFFVYLGVLALPLAITGLLYGRRAWRFRLLVLIGVSTLVIPLSAYSPLFYLIMFWEQPLRAVNHYSDIFFRLGAFFFLILAAGLGFEALLRGDSGIKRRFLLIFGLSAAWSFSLMLWLHGKTIFETPMFGFAALITVFFLIILLGISRKRERRSFHLYYFLVALMALDIATNASWHVRHYAWTAAPYEDAVPGTVGLSTDNPGNMMALNLLMIRQIKDLLDQGSDPSTLPPAGTFTFLDESKPSALSSDTANIVSRTYNTVTIEATVQVPEHLLLRDAYFQHWKATVNGVFTEIRNFDGFKVVPIPAGRSEVRFTFSPGMLPYALLLAYAVFVVVCCQWLQSIRSVPRADKPVPDDKN